MKVFNPDARSLKEVFWEERDTGDVADYLFAFWFWIVSLFCGSDWLSHKFCPFKYGFDEWIFICSRCKLESKGGEFD